MAKKKKQVVYPVFFMVLITVIFVTALALINQVTEETIRAQEELKIKRTILYVLDIEVSDDEKAIVDAYDQYVQEETINDTQVFIGEKEGQLVGYAFMINGPGLWGSMTGYAAVSADLQTILGMQFVSHSETPGLGGRVDEEWFMEQFRGVPASLDSEMVLFNPAPGGNADAITGATLTSESVRTILNSDIKTFIESMGGVL